jgi:hypothetical protein
MAEIIKTWPAAVPAPTVAQIFSEKTPPFCKFYFTLGRGRPKQPIEKVWFTYRGRILGWFEVEALVVNDGSLPRLNRLDGGESEWQIKKDAYVLICNPPCHRCGDRVFHEPFRGWRYFNYAAYSSTMAAKVRL